MGAVGWDFLAGLPSPPVYMLWQWARIFIVVSAPRETASGRYCCGSPCLTVTDIKAEKISLESIDPNWRRFGPWFVHWAAWVAVYTRYSLKADCYCGVGVWGLTDSGKGGQWGVRSAGIECFDLNQQNLYTGYTMVGCSGEFWRRYHYYKLLQLLLKKSVMGSWQWISSGYTCITVAIQLCFLRTI